MHLAVAFLLPALALAAPIADLEPRRSSGFFSLMSVRSASPIHFATINASGRAFWIGKPTSTYCPSGISGLDCSKINNNVTALATGDVGKASGAGMDTIVPGGQQVYVETNGALGYTQAHSGSIPTGAYTTGFVYTPPTNSQQHWGHLSFTGHGANGLIACPTAKAGVYQIFANVSGLKNKDKCLGFDAFALPYSGSAAWQYT